MDKTLAEERFIDLKYSIDSQIFDYPYAAGAELLTQSGLEHGQKIS